MKFIFNSNLLRYGLRTFALSFMTLLISCTVIIEPKPSVNQKPLIELYPMHIGFHHNRKQNDNYREKIEGDIVDYEFILDKPSAEFFAVNLKYIFKNVNYIDDFSNARVDNLDGVIVSDIEKFKSPVQGMPNQAEIAYIFSLYDRQKNLIGILRIWGKGTSDKQYLLNSVMRDATELAIKDAMAQLMVAFGKHPPFRRWLSENGAVPHGNIDKYDEN